MLNQLPCAITKMVAAIAFVVAISICALAQTPSPTPVITPTPTTPVQEPTPPNFPDIQPQPLPPMPDLTRVGVISSNSVPLSMIDAIRRALQNNNDIEVAREDVRVAE